MRKVVVTGLGALTPIGCNVKEYWEGLRNGVSGSELITRFNTDKFKTKFACEIKNFSAANFFSPKEINKLDRYSQFAHIAAEEAVIDSCLDLDKIDKNRVGVILSSGMGGVDTFIENVKDFILGDGTPHFSPFFVPKLIGDIAAGTISIRYGFKGPNFSTVSACASSTNAIIDAFNYIKWGKADVFLAGGSEAIINEIGLGGFNGMRAISTRNDEYKTACRPFDRTRDGFVIGEGAGTLILEEREHAQARGAHIYAEIVGSGMTADAYHLTAPHPEGLGASNAMRLAIEEAGITPDMIDYINVHGTSTPPGDIAEIKAIQHVFGEHTYKMNISSTKSMTGHLLGAAGAIEAIATILTMIHGEIPPTINFKEQDPEIDPRINITPNVSQKREVKYAISNTFGFGGHNTSIVIKKDF
jgi:3-oxoacyl-[acyl-carrier-protein] synthase II